MNFESQGFKGLLLSKKAEILQQTAGGFRSQESFKILSLILYSYWERRAKSIPFLLVISKTDVDELKIDKLSEAISALLDETLQTYNSIELDSEMKIKDKANVDFTDSNEARKTYTNLSSNGRCVFWFSKDGINSFIDGYDEGPNIFYNDADLKTYFKKKHISQIKEVIDEYRSKLKEQATYSKFFVYKTTLKRIFGKEFEKYKQLLRNKPEDTFRNDLLSYLKDKIMGTFLFAKEFWLESKNRLDIWTQDGKGNWIMIEIKWIGQSINPQDDGIGTAYDSDNIKEDAVPQILGYIREAELDWKSSVKAGYLVVYDARGIRTGDSLGGGSLEYVDAELQQFVSKFHKFDDLVVENIHPS